MNNRYTNTVTDLKITSKTTIRRNIPTSLYQSHNYHPAGATAVEIGYRKRMKSAVKSPSALKQSWNTSNARPISVNMTLSRDIAMTNRNSVKRWAETIDNDIYINED
jgi:hypothetical protein